MPEFVKAEGDSERRLSAPSGSPLERVLERDPEWLPVGGQEVPAEPEPSGDTPHDDEPEGEGDELDLDALNRQELNDLAADLGIEDAEGLPNKDAVKAAILEAKEADDA